MSRLNDSYALQSVNIKITMVQNNIGLRLGEMAEIIIFERLDRFRTMSRAQLDLS